MEFVTKLLRGFSSLALGLISFIVRLYAWFVVLMLVLFCLSIFGAAAYFGVQQIRAGEVGSGVLVITGGLLFSGLAIYGTLFESSLRPLFQSPLIQKSKESESVDGLSNQGDTPTALFITTHGSATGYHFTDKLTPDCILCGFQHNDFAPGFVRSYGNKVPPELVAQVFSLISSDSFRALPGNIHDPRIHDGFVLKITARVDRREQVIWLSNMPHPVLGPLVDLVWRSAPDKHRREYPTFAVGS